MTRLDTDGMVEPKVKPAARDTGISGADWRASEGKVAERHRVVHLDRCSCTAAAGRAWRTRLLRRWTPPRRNRKRSTAMSSRSRVSQRKGSGPVADDVGGRAELG